MQQKLMVPLLWVTLFRFLSMRQIKQRWTGSTYWLLLLKSGVIPVQGASNNRKICGLEQAFLEWQGMARIKEREAARVVSAVGGQGHSVRCDCRGKCDSKRCKCVKEGVYCSSKCHRGNACCENHEA